MTRKEIAKEFLRLCATGRVREAYERFAAPSFAASLRAGMEQAAAKFPKTRIETNIFRFERERIAELWDVAMPAPKDSPNQHGLF